VEWVLRTGRIMSIAFAVAHLAVFLLVCRSVLRIRPLLAAIAAALAWVLHAPWDFLARPDALVSLCFIGAMGLALWGLNETAGNRRTNVLFASGAVLGFVAFMAKQNGAQIVVVLFLFSLLQREWRRAAIIAAIPGLLLLITVLVGPAWFGKYYYENAVGGLNNGIRPYAAFVTTYIPVFLQLNVAALAGFATYVASGWFGRSASRQHRFLAFALCATFVLAAFSATKLGSAPHHYNDFLTILVLTLACWLSSVCRESPEKSPPVTWAVAVFAVLFFSNQAIAFRENFVAKPWQRLSAYNEIVAFMRSEFRMRPEDKLFTVDYTLANYFPNRAVVPQYSLSGIMRARGLVDFSAAQAMLDSGKVRWLLVGKEQDIERQLGFIGLRPQSYVRTAEAGGFAVWTYNKVEDVQRNPYPK